MGRETAPLSFGWGSCSFPQSFWSAVCFLRGGLPLPPREGSDQWEKGVFCWQSSTSSSSSSANFVVPLLSYNWNHCTIVFSSIYRPSCHEVDRCGSYYYTIGKSVLLAVDLLVQLGALDELAVFAKSLSKTGLSLLCFFSNLCLSAVVSIRGKLLLRLWQSSEKFMAKFSVKHLIS